jgi:hypothetical protein
MRPPLMPALLAAEAPSVEQTRFGYVCAMRAILLYGAGDVRVETVPDAHLIKATDALGVSATRRSAGATCDPTSR